MYSEKNRGYRVNRAPRHCVKNIFSKIPEKISFYLQNFLMSFLVIENCNKISTQQQPGPDQPSRGPRLKYVRGPFHYYKQTVDHTNNFAAFLL